MLGWLANGIASDMSACLPISWSQPCVSQHPGAARVFMLPSVLFECHYQLSSHRDIFDIFPFGCYDASCAPSLFIQWANFPSNSSPCPWRASLRKCLGTALKSELSAQFLLAVLTAAVTDGAELSRLVITIATKWMRHHRVLSDHSRDQITRSGSPPNSKSPWILAMRKNRKRFFFSLDKWWCSAGSIELG